MVIRFLKYRNFMTVTTLWWSLNKHSSAIPKGSKMTTMQPDHIVFGDKPFVPLEERGFRVKYHRGSGTQKLTREGDRLFIDGRQIVLFHSEAQMVAGGSSLDDLQNELKDRVVVNACVLDYLWKHPDLIPNNWKGHGRKPGDFCIHFWGTIYHDSDGDPHIRYLQWYDNEWNSQYTEVRESWDIDSPAAVLAR